MITAKHLQKYYNGFGLDCTMQVKPGYVTGLIGRNGAGKSTTFKALLGLIHIDGGEATLLGKPIDTLTAEDRQHIGVVLSNATFSSQLTVKQIVSILENMYTEFDKAFFLAQVQQANLPMKKRIKDFSTGMKAKLKVLIAISHNAKVLILDEPTAGLDVIARDELLDLLRAFMEEDEKRAILISSHISSDLESLCDDLYMMHEGKIVFHEDTDVLLSDYAILKVSEAQFNTLDQSHIICSRKEKFGYLCLTNEKQFYAENYPSIAIEQGNIDDVFTMMIRGEK